MPSTVDGQDVAAWRPFSRPCRTLARTRTSCLALGKAPLDDCLVAYLDAKEARFGAVPHQLS